MRFACLFGVMACVVAVHGAQAGTVLYSFTGGADGDRPTPGLIRDHAGNLYGTTLQGGHYGSCFGPGCGVVFKLARDGTETVLHTFRGKDGGNPNTGLVVDSAGNFYGTTFNGGRPTCDSDGCGTVFKLAPDGTETVLHAFRGKRDGAHPIASLMRDEAGNLYGTTAYGGKMRCNGGVGCGTVFKLSPTGQLTTLHAFAGGSDGSLPVAGVIQDHKGNLYGTTILGGTGTACTGGSNGCGTLFKIAPSGGLEGRDGQFGTGNLIMDKAGNLYGTTTEGGTDANCAGGCGAVFKIQPDGTESVIYSFDGSDAYRPQGGLVADRKGNLYGTAFGGASEGGVIFELQD